MSSGPPAPDCALIVMAKAPAPGLAKTRLIPALGPEGAAGLAARLLDHALRQATAAGIGPVELCCAPDAKHAAFARWRDRRDLELTDQGPGDLGARMHGAIDRRLRGTGSALLMGADAPAIEAPMLRQAAAALQTCDAVFVPALDGGYALVGLRRAAPSLFEDMPWSTSAVMSLTRRRLAEAPLTWIELTPVPDIDTPDDLQHLPAGWRA